MGSNKYELSNMFYECFLSREGSDINEVARIALYPIFGFGYIVWLTLDFLVMKK